MGLKTISIAVLALIALSGCAGGAQLYPANEKAKAIGAISLQYQADPFNGLVGTVSGATPTGETLSGQYTSVDNRTHGFGSIYGSVYGNGSSYATAMGSGGFATANGMSSFSGNSVSEMSATITPGSRYGVVNMIGSKGTIFECEYIFNHSGGGIGACKTDGGALYRMQIR